ncbi:hypothetical protein [Saccharothrix sp. HUAS TT1]|uniref:hypothetical protein n=1 Tax=unclassified Saccharothrix TaxID=2593673 RepID=UPI00345BF1D4
MADVAIGAWAKVHDGTRIVYAVDTQDESVEFSFEGDSTFQLIMSERALERCARLFPEALRNYRSAMKRGPITRSGE